MAEEKKEGPKPARAFVDRWRALEDEVEAILRAKLGEFTEETGAQVEAVEVELARHYTNVGTTTTLERVRIQVIPGRGR